MTEQTPFYLVSYIDSHFPDEVRTTLISAPHSIDRIKEILTEVHSNWNIISVILKD